MKTNNKQFIQVNILFLLIETLFLTCFYFCSSTFDMFIITLFNINLALLYCITQYYLKKHFLIIREIIACLDKDKDIIIPVEGDLAILKEKILTYNKSNTYQKDLLLLEKKKMASYIEDIAHQIKTPLTSIKINEELLSTTFNNDQLKQNQTQIERIELLLDGLLKLARLDNQTVHFLKEETSLMTIIDNALLQLQPLICSKKLHIHCNNLDIPLYVDETWMQEAIINIIKNCIEESKKQICITGIELPQFIKIEIRDDGCGILTEDKDHIFDRFYRSKSKKTHGLGIGLALSNGIIKGHHGYIEVENDNGAIFSILVPKHNLK